MKEKLPVVLRRSYDMESISKMNKILTDLSLNTVCNEAACPNMGECYKKKTATFMIMGNICTRNCRYCAVFTGKPSPLDLAEPENVAAAVKEIGLKHIVITSVTRDDLEDGGALHFAKTISAVKRVMPDSTIEVLIPDLQGNMRDIEKIILAEPDVINHNLETVPSLYHSVRPSAQYFRSLILLKHIKDEAPNIISKTGIMVGLGETEKEVYKVMDHLVEINCDILTIGQYLRPSKKHIGVKEYITQKKFDAYREIGESKGIKFVASSSLVRSSYNAIEAVEKIRRGIDCII
ncbi:lipoyl synthase [Acetobacterium carbinolicum]|uniref:lipoyl synthase n=1 Tax=Acetobacterium carbinolicum TaxID=52690 RepID=UPI003BF5F30A